MNDPTDRLGTLVVSFQQIEKDFVDLLALLLRDPGHQTAAIIAAELSFGRLVSICGALLRAHKPSQDIVDQFDNCASKALKIEKDRNRYIHSYYDLMEIGNHGIRYERIKSRNQIRKGHVRSCEAIFSSQGIDEVIQRACDLSLFIAELNERIFFTVASKAEIDGYIHG